MKKTLWVFSALIVSFCSSLPIWNPFPFFVINNPKVNSTYVQSSGNSRNKITESIAVQQTFLQYWHYFKESFKVIKNKTEQKAQQTALISLDYIKNHKLRVFLYGCATSYIFLCYQLLKGHYYYLNDLTLWSSWKHRLSFNQLLEIDQQQLANELIHDIQQRYINPNNPTDFLTPMVQFLRAIDYETKQLSFYVKLVKVVTTLRLNRIIFFNFDRVQKAGNQLQRLLFIKNIFFMWAANHNIQSNTAHCTKKTQTFLQALKKKNYLK